MERRISLIEQFKRWWWSKRRDTYKPVFQKNLSPGSIYILQWSTSAEGISNSREIDKYQWQCQCSCATHGTWKYHLCRKYLPFWLSAMRHLFPPLVDDPLEQPGTDTIVAHPNFSLLRVFLWRLRAIFLLFRSRWSAILWPTFNCAGSIADMASFISRTCVSFAFSHPSLTSASSSACVRFASSNAFLICVNDSLSFRVWISFGSSLSAERD